MHTQKRISESWVLAKAALPFPKGLNSLTPAPREIYLNGICAACRVLKNVYRAGLNWSRSLRSRRLVPFGRINDSPLRPGLRASRCSLSGHWQKHAVTGQVSSVVPSASFLTRGADFPLEGAKERSRHGQASGGYSSLRASHCRGFHCCGAPEMGRDARTP